MRIQRNTSGQPSNPAGGTPRPAAQNKERQPVQPKPVPQPDLEPEEPEEEREGEGRFR